MNPVIPELGIGLVVVIACSLMVLIVVGADLAPAGGLSGTRRWWLAAALGSGILAFAFKLALVGAITPTTIDTLLAHLPAAHRPPPVEPTTTERPLREAGPQWVALPASAPPPASGADSPALVALGRRLFFDPNLSRDRQVACVSCHDLVGGGSDARPTSAGIDGQKGQRNAPTVWNAAFQRVLFWDGRAASLEAQAAGPLLNPVEMGMADMGAVLERIRADASYRPAFAAAFGAGAPLSASQVTGAIAAFERTLVTPDSRYDRFVRGEADALSAEERRGMALFAEVGCKQCHSGPNFSEASVFGAGAPWRAFPARPEALDARPVLLHDTGLAEPGSAQGVWRVPSLRNVALTGPYFHNGAVDALEEAVRIMAQTQSGWIVSDAPAAPGTGRAYWSAGQQRTTVLPARRLSERDIGDLTAFLGALSSERLLALQRRGAQTEQVFGPRAAQSSWSSSSTPSGGLAAGMR